MPKLAVSRLLAGAPGEDGAQYAWTVEHFAAQHALTLGEMAPVERREVSLLVEAEVGGERVAFQIAGPGQTWIEVAYDLTPTEDGGTLVDVMAAGETAEVLALLPRLAPEAGRTRGANLRRRALRLAHSEEPVMVETGEDVVVMPLRRAA